MTDDQFTELRNGLKWLIMDVLDRKRAEQARLVASTPGLTQPTDDDLVSQAEQILTYRP